MATIALWLPFGTLALCTGICWQASDTVTEEKQFLRKFVIILFKITLTSDYSTDCELSYVICFLSAKLSKQSWFNRTL